MDKYELVKQRPNILGLEIEGNGFRGGEQRKELLRNGQNF